MKIIYLDEYIAVCEKSHGELSEGDEKNCIPTLLSNALLLKGEQNTSVFPVHRLDKETSGLIVLARSPQSAAALSKSIVEGELEKEYLAVLCGSPQIKEGTLTDLLFYDRNRSKSFIVDRQRNGVKKAVLDFKTLQEKNGLSLIQIKLKTRRTHQRRAQFSQRGL
ncbi:MAG: RNA pseudouridine synthase, partial [Clostridia bacterium]|nr:RNA pseudouridine synthase [Clostridia bacterium]